jgi:hypothetical protein
MFCRACSRTARGEDLLHLEFGSLAGAGGALGSHDGNEQSPTGAPAKDPPALAQESAAPPLFGLLQEKKQLVFEGTVGRDAEALGRLTEDDLRFLFG